MVNEKPTWAVVATVDEPPALIQAYTNWYLSLGASEVFLYFDRPDDPAIDLVSDLNGVTAVLCDTAHWSGLCRARPIKHEIRQVHNSTNAYMTMKSDWLLHADADEFLKPAADVAASLRMVKPSIDAVIIPVAERIYQADDAESSVFSSIFRRPFPGTKAQGRAVFGSSYDMTMRGLTGHAMGKTFVRKGRAREVSIHRPKAKTGAPDLLLDKSKGLELLHFDGLTPLHWIYKLLRAADAFEHHGGMAPSNHRRRQIEAVLSDPAGMFALHDSLKALGKEELRKLSARGLIARYDDIADKIAMQPEACNAWLWSCHGDLLQRYGVAVPKHPES